MTLAIRLIAFCCAATAASASAYAADVSIGQKNSQFSKEAVTLKVGDSITFVNNDNIFHNISVKGPSGRKTLPMQKPGDSSAVTFESSGTHQVSCVIHPKMKLDVEVK